MAYEEYTGKVVPLDEEFTEYTGELLPLAPSAGGGRGSVNPPVVTDEIGMLARMAASGQKVTRDRTWGEALTDTGAQIMEGGANIAGAIPSLIAPESGVAATTRDASEYWRNLQSEPIRQRMALADREINTAGEDGVIAQVVEAAKQYSSDPVLAARFVTTNLASMVPGIGAAKLAQAAALARGATALKAAGVATTAAGGANAVLNAGGARGGAFEEIQQAALAQGSTPEEAEQQAIEGSRMPAVVGAVTGYISGKTGLEKALVGNPASVLGRSTAARVATSGLMEAGGEQLEEVLPKVATNYEVSPIDGRALTKDIGRTMVETAIGAGPGSVLSAAATGLDGTGELSLEDALIRAVETGQTVPPTAPANTAPKVEEQSTTPTAPVVQPKAADAVNAIEALLGRQPSATADPIAPINDDALLAAVPVEGANDQAAQVDAGPEVPGGAPAVQPAGVDSAGQVDRQAAPAIPDPVQPSAPVPAAPSAPVQSVSNPTGAIPAAADPMTAGLARIEAELQASKARQTAPAPAPAPATETKPSFQAAIPQPGQTEAIVQKALESPPAHADLQDATTYPDPVLARIGGHPAANQGLREAVTREQGRRQGVIDAAATTAEQQRAENLSGQSADIPTDRPGARPLSVEGAITMMQQAKGRSLLPQEQAHLAAVKTEIGDQAFDLVKRHAEMPFRTTMAERKFDLPRIISDNNTAIAAWDKGPANVTSATTPAAAPVAATGTKPAVSYSGAVPTGAAGFGVGGQPATPAGFSSRAAGQQGNPAASVGQAVGGQPLFTARSAQSGSAPTAGNPRELAPVAPAGVIASASAQIKQQRGVQLVPYSGPATAGQMVASAFANANGRTFTLVEQTQGKKNDMPNGFMVPGTNHIVVDKDASDAPVLVAVHEIYHGLPTQLRLKTNKALRALFKEDQAGEFGREFNVTPEQFEEEIPAYMAQAVASRPTFWQELRTKMGNRDFAALASHILNKFKQLMSGADAQLGEGFLQKYIGEESKILEAQRILTDVYAESMREQGLQPDAAVMQAPMMESRKPVAVGDFQTVQNKDGSMTVRGNPDEIRALMPEGIQGRVTKDGVAFTHSDAPRVRHALEGNNTAYSRGGQVTEKLVLTKDGKYLGAPEKFNTPGKIPHLRKWLIKLTKEGEAGRFWYENSSKAILRMVGGDKVEARKFAALLAIYSPQAKVDTNGTFALRAWAQYKAGQPISVKTGVMDAKAQAALDNVDEFWSGEKTGNFVTNLLRNIDPHLAQGATIDMWMMRAAQYDNDAPTKTQYAFMENETNRIARELGWEPQQVQAAIWVAMKARMENDGVKKAVEAKSEKKGGIHYDYPLKNGKPQKTRVIDDAAQHRGNWLDQALTYDPSTNDTQRAKFDFEDSLRRHIGQVSWEARPGRSTGVLPGVNDAPYDQQVEFQQAVQKALMGPNGEDLLAQQLGLLTDGEDLLAPGVWQGEVAAGMQKSMAMAPAKGDGGKTSLDETQKKNLDIYSAVLGLLLRQEGVGWHRPFYNGKTSGENGVEIRIGQAFTPEQARELWAAVDSRMRAKGVADWEQGAGMISSPEGMRVVNFGALEDNKQFKALVADAITDVSVEAHLKDFTSDGNLVTNDWKADQNGQGFISHIRDSGRSDLLGWSRDVLAPRVQRVFDEFSEKYDWGNPGTIAFSNKSSDGLSGVHGESGPGSRAHAVRVEGTHFSQQPRTSLDGRYNGRGLKGAEGTRLAQATDSRIKERVYFYVNEGKGLTPEAGVGGYAHLASIDNLYNVQGDPLKLFKSGDANGSETRVLDAGFDGYYFPNYVNGQGIAVVLGNASRGIKVTQSEYTKGTAPAAIPQPYKRGLSSKELNAIDVAAVQAVAPSAKLRAGTFQVDESELDAARSELANQGIELPATVAFSNKATNLDQDITLTIPVEGGKTAKLTVNAAVYIKQLDARQSALEMVKECML